MGTQGATIYLLRHGETEWNATGRFQGRLNSPLTARGRAQAAVERKPVDNARERYLTAEEAARLREAASASRNPMLRPIVDLLMLTGARVGELLGARWDEVDLERRSRLIPKSRRGGPVVCRRARRRWT